MEPHAGNREPPGVTDAKGRKLAVQINLKRYGAASAARHRDAAAGAFAPAFPRLVSVILPVLWVA
jgi:hypothetical protein